MNMSLNRLFSTLDTEIENRRCLEGIFNASNVDHLWHHLTENVREQAKPELRQNGSLSVERLHDLYIAEIQAVSGIPLPVLCEQTAECPHCYDPARYSAGACPCGVEVCFIDTSSIYPSDDTAVSACGIFVELRGFPESEWVIPEMPRFASPWDDL